MLTTIVVRTPTVTRWRSASATRLNGVPVHARAAAPIDPTAATPAASIAIRKSQVSGPPRGCHRQGARGASEGAAAQRDRPHRRENDRLRGPLERHPRRAGPRPGEADCREDDSQPEYPGAIQARAWGTRHRATCIGPARTTTPTIHPSTPP